ncbi:hypothetical protein AOX55_00002545 [Sinorhizobium fredii CCBAU 25509]|nr:hypothetical protein AOX55_00002545 [Sinorhizobium fredii CCBAU 25509]
MGFWVVHAGVAVIVPIPLRRKARLQAGRFSPISNCMRHGARKPREKEVHADVRAGAGK